MMRRATAALLAFCLVLQSFPVGLAAQTLGGRGAGVPVGRTFSSPAGGLRGPAAEAPAEESLRGPADRKTVLAYLKTQGVFTDDSDPIFSYLVDGDSLSPLGEIMYAYLKSLPNPAEEVSAMQDQLAKLREGGLNSEKKREAVRRVLASFEEKFGRLSDPNGTSEDIFRFGTLREAIMTGAAAADAPKKEYTQFEIPDGSGWEFYDREGLAFRLNKHQTTVYNRELQKAQRVMNQSRPPQVAFIPETGRYNEEMIQYSYYRLLNQLGELDNAYHIDRMINMAELLGKQYKDDMWFREKGLEADLERWAKNKKFNHNGVAYTVFDIVEAKMKGRAAYMASAREGLKRFEYEMGRLKGLESVSEARIQTMQMHEQYVMRYLSLTFLETQKFHVKNQIDRLDPKSPDSEMLDKALAELPLDEATRQRYQLERAKLRARVEGLRKRLLQTQDVLFKSDYAGNLDLVGAALNAAQKELGELSLDYSLFTEVPSSLYLSKDQLGAWSLKGWAVKAYWKSGVHGSHSRAMDKIDGMMPQYKRAAELMAVGDYWGARKAMVAASPDAFFTRGESSLAGGSIKATEALKVTAAMKDARMAFTQVMGTNQWVQTAGNYITWTVSLALMAPLMSGVLSGVGKFAGALNEGLGLARLPVARLPLKIIEEAALHASTRLNTLSPDPRNIPVSNPVAGYFAYSGVRLVNAGARQASFSLLAGGISSLFTAGGHVFDEVVPEFDFWIVSNDKDRSIHNSVWEAAGVGFKGGVVWANESFHPLLGYVGLPSSAFEGGWLARPAEVLGSHGAVGSLGRLAQGVGMPISERLSLQTLSQAGRFGAGSAFALGMADNVAKYALFSAAVAKGMEWKSWLANSGEADVEWRIKKAQKEGMWWMDSAVWMLIPVFPAKYEAAAADHIRAKQGQQEFDAAGRRAEYANAAEGQELPLLGKSQIPVSQRIFNLRWLGSVSEGATWRVTKEIRRQGMAAELVEALGGKGAKAGDVNPMEFFKTSQLPDGDMVGKLHLNDEVRLEAREKFGESLLARVGLAESILKANLGSEVPGFGRVTPTIKKEVAVAIHMARSGHGPAVPEALSKAADAILKPYLESEMKVKPAAEKLMTSVRALKTETEVFQKEIDAMVRTVLEWREGAGKAGSPHNNKGYMQLVGELKARSEGNSALSVTERAVLRSVYEYIEAIEARFNSFNKVSITFELAMETISALRTQYAGRRGALSVVEGFEGRLRQWREAQGPDTAAAGPGRPDYRNMVGEFMREVKAAREKGSITHAEADVLMGGLRELDAAPWVLHDSKGSALPSWRPEQFESLMIALGLVATQGRGGMPIRDFLLLKTGGGKTMMVFEGLLPLAEADAAHHKMQVTFLTVQSNLEAQARLEFQAYKKIASKLEFMTYEEFKAKIAEKKLVGKDIVKKHWIFGDEGDGAALQPLLTIGEVTAQVARVASVYKLIESMQKTMEGRLGQAPVELAEAVRADVRRAQNALQGLEAGSAEAAAAKQLSARLLRAADQLALARTPEEFGRAKSQIEGLLTRQSAVLESRPLAADAKLLSRLSKLNTQLSAAAEKLDAAKTSRSFETAATKIRDILTQQQSLLDTAELAGSVRGKSIKSAAESLRARLDNAVKADKKGAFGSRQDFAREAREAAEGQKRALGGREPLDAEAARVVREAFERIGRTLATRPELDAKARATILAELTHALHQQQNLLGLVRESPLSRVESLWTKAGELKAAAETRLESINKQVGALEAQVSEAKARGANSQGLESRLKTLRAQAEAAKLEISITEGFRLGSPELASTRKGHVQLRETAQRRLEVLDREIIKAREELAAAEKAGGPGDAVVARIKSLEIELAAANKDMKLASRSAAPTRKDAAQVRNQFERDALEILAIIKEGAPGWEGRAIERFKLRSQMLEGYAKTENPIYEIYRKMKEEMHSVAYSSERLSEDPVRAQAAADVLGRKIDGQGLLRLGASAAKNLLTGRPMHVSELGLTRIHAVELLKAVMSDPAMPYSQKFDLFWTIAPSTLWPRGPTGKGSSWVRNELINMARGYFDPAGNIRMDNLSGKVNVVHNGQWFESMDTPTRRFWELEYGTDLTLPYRHKTVSNIKDITTEPNSRFILLSGTLGKNLRQHFETNKARIGGTGSKAPEGVRLDLRDGPSGKIASVKETLLKAAGLSSDLVVVNPSHPDVPKPFKAWLDAAGHGKKDGVVVRISEIPAGEARGYAETLKKGQGASSLTVISVADTPSLKLVRNYLIRSGLLKPEEIAMVFSDAEWLRVNRPQSKVVDQMNLAGLNGGKVKVLILDTRVGGRGLDLNFKGLRDNPDPAVFKGYTNYEMLILDPHEMSVVHLLQAQGRIDVGRVLSGAPRGFGLVMDVKAVAKEPLFREMFDKDPFFAEVRKDPALIEFAKRRGRPVDWALVHDFVNDAASAQPGLAKRYEEAVSKTLERQQSEVERDQLRSSSILEDPPSFHPKYRGLNAGSYR